MIIHKFNQTQRGTQQDTLNCFFSDTREVEFATEGSPEQHPPETCVNLVFIFMIHT